MNTSFSCEQPSLQDLERALRIAAKVVALYGDVYLPGFIRLKNELEKAKNTEDAKSYALRLASD